MYIVGLTGGIGSGKSAASEYFEQLGVRVVDADLVARQVVTKGSTALESIRQHFGDDILTTGGELNRARLRHIIFAKAEEKQWLEQLLHPLIRQEIERQLHTACGDYAILTSPLLIESKQLELTQRLAVVDVPSELQSQRACQRDNNSRQQIEAIMAAQLPRQERLTLADDIIDNSGSLATLHQQISRLHQQYLQLASEQ